MVNRSDRVFKAVEANAMRRDPNCIFCKILSAEIPASVVYENQAVIAFMDNGPLADGHLLVVPKDHFARLTNLPGVKFAQVAEAIPYLGRALLRVTGAEGFNLLCNEGQAAGQAVGHVHFHLIPRRSGDGLGYRWNAGKYPPGRDAELAAAYQKALAEHAP
ncbi:MAG: HIT family protein [Planctomycetota bacterium]